MMRPNLEPAPHEAPSRIGPLESEKTGKTPDLLGGKSRGCLAHVSATHWEAFGRRPDAVARMAAAMMFAQALATIGTA